jgi:hypothetical protein
MAEFKLISDHQQAAERFISEVGTNAVRYYDIRSFQANIIPSVYPATYLDKCTSMTVAVSGSRDEGLDWMVFCPQRVDKDKKAGGLVYDIDPLILTLDSIQKPSPIGVIGYHLKFPGRVTPIAGYSLSDYATSVSELRHSIITGLAPLEQIPSPVEQAIGYMANYFRNKNYGA